MFCIERSDGADDPIDRHHLLATADLIANDLTRSSVAVYL